MSGAGANPQREEQLIRAEKKGFLIWLPPPGPGPVPYQQLPSPTPGIQLFLKFPNASGRVCAEPAGPAARPGQPLPACNVQPPLESRELPPTSTVQGLGTVQAQYHSAAEPGPHATGKGMCEMRGSQGWDFVGALGSRPSTVWPARGCSHCPSEETYMPLGPASGPMCSCCAAACAEKHSHVCT